jgi:hypothetical protein
MKTRDAKTCVRTFTAPRPMECSPPSPPHRTSLESCPWRPAPTIMKTGPTRAERKKLMELVRGERNVLQAVQSQSP